MGDFKKKIKHKLSISTYQRPLVFVILTMALINIAVLIVAAIIALIIDDTFANFIQAFVFGSVTWMLTPNAILGIDNPATLLLAVIVLIIGLVLFSGTIIALTTNAIKEYFEKKKGSKGHINLTDHILILNYNNKVPELIADLVHVKTKTVTILILAHVQKEMVENKILDALKKTKPLKTIKHVNVLVKEGDPLSQKDLLDCSIQAAQTILVMSHPQLNKGKDLNVIKILLSLSRFTYTFYPPIVIEIKHYDTKEKIYALKATLTNLTHHHLIPICFDKRLGQIIAQTLIQKEMEDVYLSLFSFDGSEVYHLEASFEACLNDHTHAIPIAKTDQGLFVISDDNHSKTLKRPLKYQPTSIEFNPINEQVNKTILVMGNNAKKPFIEESFKAYETLHHSTFNATFFDTYDDYAMYVKTTQEPYTLLILSDESVEDDQVDANIFDALLRLETLKENKPSHVIVELLDPKNDALVKEFQIENTIISNKIISLLLSKLALFKETEAFYEELLTIDIDASGKDKQAVTIQPVNQLIKAFKPMTFPSIKALCKTVYEHYQDLIPIGVIQDGNVFVFKGDFSAQPCKLYENDQIILMKI